MISSHIFTLVHKYISTFNDKPIVICSLLVSPKNMKGSCISNKQTSSLLPKHRSEVYKRSAERKQSSKLSSIRNSAFKSQVSRSRRSSLSDSDSSDTCFEKKFYRCGCLNHNSGCGHKYQNYLAELRQERMRKKQKMIDFFQEKEQKREELVLSDDDRPLADSFPETPPRLSQLQRIAELNQSAELSIRKFEFEIRIVLEGKTYFKILRDKEEAIKCLLQLERELKSP